MERTKDNETERERLSYYDLLRLTKYAKCLNIYKSKTRQNACRSDVVYSTPDQDPNCTFQNFIAKPLHIYANRAPKLDRMFADRTLVIQHPIRIQSALRTGQTLHILYKKCTIKMYYTGV